MRTATTIAAVAAFSLLLAACGPRELGFEDAKPHAVAWMTDHCKQYRCDNQAGPYGALVNSYALDQGWVFVIQVQPERAGGNPTEMHLLVPHRNPRDRQLL